ncbi:fish-egg lectin-like protein [Lates japonicus]|uniref:Fish-egg lectin-like protein n=1 Tax=Lates japonicus TaxID=270547 RepID=A0AAD3M628_LATJO|nr:fish-egg lectin-like protein [Lates japonicus]
MHGTAQLVHSCITSNRLMLDRDKWSQQAKSHPNSCGYSSWRYVSGLSMKMIEVASDGSVFGVSTNGRVYQRTGI